MAEGSKRPHDAEVEPLFAALDTERPRPSGASLRWKILWAGLVFFGLLALVLKQAF